MRLDHLLSKEQLASAVMVCGAVASPPANVWWGVLKGGTSIIWHRTWFGSQVQLPLGEWKATGTGTVPDTLLGPEGSDESLTSGRFTALDPYRGRTAELAR